MISHDAQVLGHRMPLRRIELQPVWPAERPRNYIEKQVAEMARAAEIAQGERMWEVTRQVAQGVNPPTRNQDENCC